MFGEEVALAAFVPQLTVVSVCPSQVGRVRVSPGPPVSPRGLCVPAACQSPSVLAASGWALASLSPGHPAHSDLSDAETA